MTTAFPEPPTRPDGPNAQADTTAPKNRKWLVVGAVIGGLMLLGAVFGDDPAPTGSTTSATEETMSDAEADQAMIESIVDISIEDNPKAFKVMCEGLPLLGYDQALKYFTDGYGYGQDPSAEEVFDETLSRC